MSSRDQGVGMARRWDFELFVDGSWTTEGAVGTIDVIDPATEESIGSVPEAPPRLRLGRSRQLGRRSTTDPGPG
ncbi:MAG: hypothetical protein M5U19_08995 [Microthrixaceae bacterium]|nr:hypothetical protein [Microthrixaceae bacterium]